MSKLFLLLSAIAVVELSWRWLRLSYLKARQNKVSIDLTKEVTLRYAVWSYFFQAAGLFFCAYFFIPALSNKTSMIVRFIFIGMSVLSLTLTIVTFISRLRTRVVIGVGKQIFYFDGHKRELIYSGSISNYSCGTYFYYITKKDGNKLKIPTTLKGSEIVMAFLEDAISDQRVYHKSEA